MPSAIRRREAELTHPRCPETRGPPNSNPLRNHADNSKVGIDERLVADRPPIQVVIDGKRLGLEMSDP